MRSSSTTRFAWWQWVLALALSGCCSAAAGASVGPIGGAPPIAPVTNNGGGGGGGAGVVGVTSAASRYVLWCARPGGSACTRAASALGVTVTDVGAIPETLLTQIRDTEDDCSDPEIAQVTAMLTGPLGITARNWHDNVGGQLARESVPQTYSGGGCTNCCFAPTEPAVKLHVVATAEGTRWLVRVWEPGEFVNAKTCR